MEFSSVNSSISPQNPCVIGQCLSRMNEELLISAAKTGDRNAFDELYVRHSRKVLQRIYGITRNREDAEDALQEAALNAFLHLRTFEGRSSFSSWLSRIAINSALMSLRKKRIAEISIDQTFDDEDGWRRFEPRDDAETPEARYSRCEIEALLVGKIHRMPLIFRQVLELQHSHEYSTAQIAEELGISESAAKSRLMRARKTLSRPLKARIRSQRKSSPARESAKPQIHSRPATVRQRIVSNVP